MTKQRSSRPLSQTLVVLTLAAAFAAADAGRPAAARGQLPTRGSLPSSRHYISREPFRSCYRNSPAPMTLRLSATMTDSVGTAKTDGDFFVWPADSGRELVLTDTGTKGKATIIAFTNAMRVTVRITQAFPSSGIYARGTWSRWPICYTRITDGKFGFNAGVGHQKGNTDLTLDFSDQHYSVDRCSLAHDNYYWGPKSGDPGPSGQACNNNFWVGFCFGKIQRRTAEEEEAYLWLDDFWQKNMPGVPLRLFRPAILDAWRTFNPCTTKRDWIELPTNPRDIRNASCYLGPGRFIVGLQGKALDVSGGSHDNGATVILWDKHGGCNQKWRMVPGTGNPTRYGYEIRGFGGKCLSTPNDKRPRPGDRVQMRHCNNRYTQKWHHEHGQIRVQDRRTPRLCLDVDERASPMTAIVAKCASINPQRNPSQQWRFVSQ